MYAIAFKVRLFAWLVVTVAATGCSDSAKQASGSPRKAVESTAEESVLIEPGVAVGKIRSGMTIQDVIKELGEPERRTGNAMEYLHLGFAVMPSRDGVVRTVMCGGPESSEDALAKAFTARTKEGIGMGSSRATVLKAYGIPTRTSPMGTGHERLIYQPAGLTFTLNRNDNKVHHIIVDFRNAGPGTATNSTGTKP